jgi:hypothetical protein
MTSSFPYKDRDQATKFALGYFERLRADPDIRQTWLGLQSLIQVHITAPDIAVYVDTRDGETMIVTAGVCPEPAALTLTLGANVFHRIYAGEMNVFLAFATRKIKTRGNVALIMKTTWTLPQAIHIYRQYGTELGLPGKTCQPPGRALSARSLFGDDPRRLGPGGGGHSRWSPCRYTAFAGHLTRAGA